MQIPSYTFCAIDLVEGMVSAFHNAHEETRGKELMSSMQTMKAVTQEAREGMILILTFLQNFFKKIEQINP